VIILIMLMIYHAVVHDLVPVFTGDNTKQQDNGVQRRLKVGLSTHKHTHNATMSTSYRSTQPGHPSVGRRNEYQPKGGDALRLGSKGRYGL